MLKPINNQILNPKLQIQNCFRKQIVLPQIEKFKFKQFMSNKNEYALIKKIMVERDNYQHSVHNMPKKQEPLSLINKINKLKKDFKETKYIFKILEICRKNKFSQELTADIVLSASEFKLDLINKICNNKNFEKKYIANILINTFKNNVKLAEKICSDKDFPQDKISEILNATNEENFSLAQKLCTDKEFPKKYIAGILDATNKDNIEFAKTLCYDKNYNKREVVNILALTFKDDIELAKKLYADKNFPKECFTLVLGATNNENIEFAQKLYANNEFSGKTSQVFKTAKFLRYADSQNMDLAEILYKNKDFRQDRAANFLMVTANDNLEFAKKAYADNRFLTKSLVKTVYCVNKENLSLAQKLYDKKVASKYIIPILQIFNGGEDFILEAIDSGIIKKFPQILNYPTKNWKNIAKRNLAEHPLFLENTTLINAYAESQNDDIVEMHQTFLKNVFGNKKFVSNAISLAMLKSVFKLLNSEALIKTLDVVGTKTTEVAFLSDPKVFENFMKDVSNLQENLSDENKNLLNRKLRTADFINANLFKNFSIIKRIRVLNGLQKISNQEEMTKFINLISCITQENLNQWNNTVTQKIFKQLDCKYNEQILRKINFIINKALSKPYLTSSEMFQNLDIIFNTIKNNPELTNLVTFIKVKQNIEKRYIYEAVGIKYNCK